MIPILLTIFLILSWIYLLFLALKIRRLNHKILKKENELSDFKLELTNKEIQLNQSVDKANNFADKLYLSYSQLSDLDSLLREINSAKDLKSILQSLAKYIKEKYEIPHYVLYTYDQKTSELVFYDSNFPEELSLRAKNEISSRRIPLNSATTTKYAHAYSWKRKRSFFISDLTKYKTTGIELENQISVNLKSLLIVPLFLRQNFIGTLDLLDYSGNLKLTEQEINQIKIIGDYIAGSIETGFLLDELQLKNQQIEKEKKSIELNQEKLESLNRLMRNLNSFNQIDDIVLEVLQYLKSFHRVELAFLLLVDEKHNCLQPLLTSKEVFNKGLQITHFFKNFKVELNSDSGSLFRTYSKRKPLYIRKALKANKLSNYDQKIVEAFDLDSIAQIPLVVRNKCIGIFCLTQLSKEMNWSKTDFIEICSFSEQVAGAIHNAYLLKDLELEREKSRKMLRNILPDELAAELMETGEVIPMEYESATILFTDFKNFTASAELLSPEALIFQLDTIFSQFDDIALRHTFEKLKTIGDSYMAAGGIPQGNFTHPVDACLFALEIRAFINRIRDQKLKKGLPFWEIRIGIHTGSIVAGVVGKTKFAYDVWGDTVNIASRMESSSTPGEINLSEKTYEKVKRFFVCEYRGKLEAKNKGQLDMYFLKRLKPEFSLDKEGVSPNETFLSLYKNLQIGAKIIYKYSA